MIVATAILIFLTLFFAPISFVASIKYLVGNLDVDCQIKAYSFNVVKENIFFDGQGIGYTGTVDGRVEISKLLDNNGFDLAKSIVINKVIILTTNDFSNCNIESILFSRLFSSILTSILSKMTVCQVASVHNAFGANNKLYLQLYCQVSIAELSFCFIKQGVSLWTHKFRKS